MIQKSESDGIIIFDKKNDHETLEADYIAEKEKPLRTVVMLHTESVWIGMILLTIVIEFQIILYNVSFRGRLFNVTNEPREYSMQTYLIMMDALYCADFLLALSYRSWKSVSSISAIKPRDNISLAIDVISLIPVDIFLWYGSNLAITNPRIFHSWSMNHLLRIYRVYGFFYKARHSIVHVSVQIHLLEIVTVLLVLSMISTVAMFEWEVDIENDEYGWLKNFVQSSDTKNWKVQDWFWVSYYIVIGHISSHGTINFPPETNHLRFTIFAMISALGIRSLLLAYMVDVIQRRDYVKSIFTLKRMILSELLTSAVKKNSRDEIYKYYRFYWDTEMGEKFDIDTFFMYPLIFRAECSLELSWDTFKHSKLFREMPVPFLRNVSLLFKRRFVLPGDYILKKFELMDCLIYIVSGSVYVLSEEDNSTPILSFSGGTIFGEIALLASSRSRVSILACTPCELNVLKRNDFARIIVPIYPDIYQYIIESINDRISKARFTKKISIHLKKNENIFDGNRYTDVAWLKKTLNALQDAKQVNGDSEKYKERQDLIDQVYASSDIRYTFVYLDTMVLSNDLALTSDAVFLQSSKCPWILQPDSKVLLMWDILVLLCSIVLAYILVVSITFHEFETEVIYAWMNFLGILLTVDLWVIVSTAIQKNDRITITKVSQILKIRLHDWKFLLDILSAVPWTLLVSQLSNQTNSFRFIRLNRLLKLYKLEMMFTRIENSHKLSLVALRTIKYILYISMLSFLLTAFALIITCEGDKETAICSATSWITIALTGKDELTKKTFSYSYLVILQTILGIGTPLAKLSTPKECAYWIVLIIISSLLFIFYIASLTSVRVLGQVVLTSNFHLGKAIHYHLNKTTVPSVLKKRVDSYLETELYYDKGYRLAMKEDVLGTLSTEVSAQWKFERFGHLVGNVPLFVEIGEGFIKDICSVVKVAVLPPRELLSYGGRRCTEMYIIEKGYCEMIHMEESIPHRKVGPGTEIYPLEMCLKLPVVHTVVTLTYVSFLTINRSDFLRMYSNYPEDKIEFHNLLSEFEKIERVMELKELVKEPPEFIEVLHSIRPPVPSFTFFVYTLNKEDPAYYVINEPFERLKNLKIIKWILLRFTIRPDGIFMKFYEIQRCFCAIMTLIFYTMRIVIDNGNGNNYTLKIIITFLNVAAVFDIYFKMHVGFFNEKGLLVTHPLTTAKNYIKTSMFVDVIGVVPFEQLILGEKASSTDLFYFYLTRVLQLYRVVGGINYLQESGALTRIIKYGKYLPILIVVAHVFACVILYNSCTFDEEFEDSVQFGAGVRCPQERTLIEASDEYKLTVWVLYRKSLYIAMSTLTRVGAEELQIKTLLSMKIFYVMSSVTFIVLLFLMGQIMADSAIRDGELTAYQDRMTTMVKFLKNKKISPELYEEVVSYFELAWKHKRGQAIDQLLKTFHSSLREDVLCVLYRKSLSKNPGLVNSSETFYRYLLMHIKEVRFYPHGSVIVHYNDVINFVVIIHTGSAEVVAPDGSLITSLGPGSIFGNLIGSTTVRMPISIVVTAHMEALIFNSNEFFRALSIHRKARKVFLDAMKLNTDYIAGNSDEHETEISKENLSSDDKIHNNATIFKFLHFLSIRVMDPNWLPIVLWDRNSLFFSCYLSPCAIIYQIAFGDFHQYWIFLQYLTDFLFLSTIYLKVHSAYEDNYGNIVRDKKRIWIRFIKSPMGFYIHFISILPIEVIAFLFEGKTFQKLYAWLRLNRILRLAVIIDFFNVQCKRLNINIFNMRIAYLVTILFFTIHLASCIQANIMTEIDIYEMDHISRATLYFKKMYIVASLYSGSITRRLSVNSSWYETFYILTLEIVIFVIFALIVGDMCAMIDVRHFVMITYERVIKRFKTYMETCDLTYVLKRNLWTYGCNLWEFNRGRQIPHLVLEAPNYLRGSIKNALFIHHLENHYIFTGCHEDFLRQIAHHFILINYFDDDLIVNYGDINGDMYFINSGRVVTIYYESFNNTVKENRREIFEEGESFGILSGLYPRYPHAMTHRAFGKCQILVLNRMKWYYLLKHFPASENHIYSIANKLRAQSMPVKLSMSTDNNYN